MVLFKTRTGSKSFYARATTTRNFPATNFSNFLGENFQNFEAFGEGTMRLLSLVTRNAILILIKHASRTRNVIKLLTRFPLRKLAYFRFDMTNVLVQHSADIYFTLFLHRPLHFYKH